MTKCPTPILGPNATATPFDIPDIEFTHYEDPCTFDFFLERYEIEDPALTNMAVITLGADTDDHLLATQSLGLWAISPGITCNIINDQELLEKGTFLWMRFIAGQGIFKSRSTRKAPQKSCFWLPPLWLCNLFNQYPKSLWPGWKSIHRFRLIL